MHRKPAHFESIRKQQGDDGRLPEFWSIIPAIISGSVALSVLLTVLYNWAYFQTIGRFTPLISLSDIIGYAIFWLPLVGLTFSSAVILSGFIAMPATKLVDSEKYSTFVIFFYGLVVIALLVLFLFSTLNFWAPIAIALGITGAISGILNERAILKAAGKLGLATGVIFPITCGLSLAIGNMHALADLRSTSTWSSILTKGSTSPIDVAIFRYSERGVLFRRRTDRDVMFLAWDNIVQIDHGPLEASSQIRICELAGIGCPTITQSPPAPIDLNSPEEECYN